MFKKLLVIATLAAGLISTQASAAFVPTDWKSSGDGLATLDTETGLEWLDLTQTGGKSINEVKALLGTTYEGWRMPTYEEIYQLASSMFPIVKANPGVTIDGKYSGNDLKSFSLWGQNVGSYTYGMYEREGSTYFWGAYGTRTYFDYLYANHLDRKGVYEGVFLVSDGGTTLSSINDPTLNINNPNAPINMADVSTPAGLAAAGVLMLMLGARRKTA